MARISIYSPQIRVPIISAPLVQPDQTGYLVADEATRVYEAYERRQKQDAQVTLATEKINADHKFTLEFLDAKNNGTLNDASPQQVIDNVNNHFEQLKEQYKDNRFVLEALPMLQAEQQSYHTERMIIASAEANRINRMIKLRDAFATATSTVAIDPTQLPAQEQVLSTAIDALPAGSPERASAEAFRRDLAPSAIEAMLQSTDLAEIEKATALLKGGAYKEKIDGRATIALLEKADARRKEIWNQNYLVWGGNQQEAAASGKKVSLPDPSEVGPDNYQRARMALYNPPKEKSATEARREELEAEVSMGNTTISPTDNERTSAADRVFDKSLTSWAGGELGTDELGNVKGTPDEIIKAKRELVYKHGALYTNQWQYAPAAVVNELTRAARSKDPAEFQRGAELYRQITSNNHAAVTKDFPPEHTAKFESYLQMTNEGKTSAEAIADLQEDADRRKQMGSKAVETLRNEFLAWESGAIKGAGGERINFVDNYLADQLSGVSYDAEYRRRVRERAAELFATSRESTKEGAVRAAARAVSKGYGRSLVNTEIDRTRYILMPQNPFRPTAEDQLPNKYQDPRGLEAQGAPVMMANPPEILYGDPKATQAENAAWIQDQVVETVNKLKTVSKQFDKYHGNLRLMPAPSNILKNGQRGYIIQYYNSSGWNNVKRPGSKTEPYIYTPDRMSSPGARLLRDRAAKQDEKARETARRQREMDKTPIYPIGGSP